MLSTHELKQIQLSRQHLTEKSDKITVCHDLNGLQAQIMVNVFYSLKIRCNEEINKDNFGDGLVKNWTVRGTIHAFAADDLGLFKYNHSERYHLSHDWDIEKMRWHCRIPPDRLEYIAKFIVDKVASGVTARENLKEECYRAGMTEAEGAFVFDQWGGLFHHLCDRGFLCHKVCEKKEFMICPPFIPMEKDDAVLEQVRRYFNHFAPATVKDAAYYFGCSQTHIKEIMQKLPLKQIEVDGKNYFYSEELKRDYPDIPHCILLAGFDQFMLGYQKKDSIYLPEKYIRGIFNLAGIVMPPILLDGVVSGRWRKKNTKMIFEMFGDISAQNKKHIELIMEETFNDIRKVEWAFI